MRTGTLLYPRPISFSFLYGTCCPIMQHVPYRNWKILTVVSIYPWFIWLSENLNDAWAKGMEAVAKSSRLWLIPKDAEKPADKRRKDRA